MLQTTLDLLHLFPGQRLDVAALPVSNQPAVLVVRAIRARDQAAVLVSVSIIAHVPPASVTSRSQIPSSSLAPAVVSAGQRREEVGPALPGMMAGLHVRDARVVEDAHLDRLALRQPDRAHLPVDAVRGGIGDRLQRLAGVVVLVGQLMPRFRSRARRSSHVLGIDLLEVTIVEPRV
jgi:hypothetical protein